MAKISPVEEHFINKALESNFALWNALLTVNGIMLTAFSILALAVPSADKQISLLLVGCCSVSLLLLVWNFLVTKEHYLSIGRMLSRADYDLTEAQRKTDIDSALRRHRNVHRREKAALFLLLGETGLVILLLVLGGN